jgi:hypothetical protein
MTITIQRCTNRKYFVLFLEKYFCIIPSPYINKDMKYRYFQYRLKPTKEQRKILESYGSAMRWVWNYFLELNRAALNIQREAINILNWTGTVQIQTRGDTSGGDVAYAMAYDTSGHVSVNREKFLSQGKEAAFYRAR